MHIYYPTFKNICLTLANRYSTIKSKWFNIALLLEASANKYFRVLIDTIAYQMSPIIYLLCKSPLTATLNFNFLRLSIYWIFSLYTSMHGVTVSPFSGSPVKNI